jgi:RimJ/RimL family protein N-acetyltransferase
MTTQNSALIFLRGKRVNLRTQTEADAPTLLEIVHSDLARENTLQIWPRTIEDELAHIKKSSGSGAKFPTDIGFGIELVENQRLIGVMAIHQINWVDKTAKTGSMIGYADCVSKGYGSEAKMMLLDYAFNTLGLRIIYSEAITYNKRSNGSLEKCGYQKIGTFQKKHFRKGEYHDVNIYECTAKSFRKAFQKWNKDRK